MTACTRVVICPSGCLLIGVSIPLCKNISLNPSGKSSLQIRAISPEGRIMIVRKRGEGCGGRGSIRRAGVRRAGFARERKNGVQTNDAEADGKTVRS
jgi:hypothetical protein